MFEAIEKPKIQKVDPEYAKAWLELNTFPGQRPLRYWHVALLRNKIANGEFRTGEVAIAVLAYDRDREVLMNGQHQLTAVVQSGKAITAKVERFRCATAADASHLFRQFDNTQRSLADMVKVEAVAMDLGWPPRICGLVVSAAAAITNRANEHPSEKVKIIKEFAEQGQFVADILFETVPGGAGRDKRVKHLMRAPVVGAMMKTFVKDAQAASRFWLLVRDGVNLGEDRPEYKLREFLKDAVYSDGRGLSRLHAGRSSTGHEIYARCITAWNAVRRGKSTNLAYHANKPVPEPV
jgi:hypothetical protein